MKYTQAIAMRIREVFLDGTWVANTNYKLQLSDCSWQMATARIDPINTIAILAQHIHYYLNGVKNVLKGGSLDIKDQYSFDFPAITSQQQWESFLDQFLDDAEEFALLLEQMPDEKLKQIFVKQAYGTYQRNMDGMIEHSYYHLGQIVLLKKLVTARAFASKES